MYKQHQVHQPSEGVVYVITTSLLHCSITCYVADPLYHVPDAPYSAIIREAKARAVAANTYNRPIFSVTFYDALSVQIAVDSTYFESLTSADILWMLAERLGTLTELETDPYFGDFLAELRWRANRANDLTAPRREYAIAAIPSSTK